MTRTDPSSQAPRRIDLRSGDVDHWTQRFGLSREELAKAVEAAGDDPDEVADYLEKNGIPASPE